MRLLDLSHPFDPALYARKERPELEIRPLKTVAANGVSTLEITFGTHIGTHVDAPCHLVEGGASVDMLPLDTFHGTSVVLDIPKGPNGGVSWADLAAAQPAVARGDIVLIRSGWGDKLTDPTYPTHHPYLTVDGAEWLVATGVRMVGMDVQSVDLPHSLREMGFRYTSLRVLLEHGIPALHNLRGLEAVCGRRITVFALPIGFRGVDGAPVRVVAALD